MDTKRGIWEEEEAFLGPFKGVAKAGGTGSVLSLTPKRIHGDIPGTASIKILRSKRFAARTPISNSDALLESVFVSSGQLCVGRFTDNICHLLETTVICTRDSDVTAIDLSIAPPPNTTSSGLDIPAAYGPTPFQTTPVPPIS